MKFFHVADVHLGMRPEKDSLTAEVRERELFESFYNIVRRAGKEQADLLLVAGDMFHRQPKVRELKEIDACFAQIPNVKVVIIAGNHDYIDAGSPYQSFCWSENVTFIKSADLTSVYFEDINTEITGFSFLVRDIRDNILKNVQAVNQERINILLAHGGDSLNAPFVEKELDASGFDYIALGHIHKAGAVGKLGQYPGSPEPLNKNENGHHGYIRGEILPDAAGGYTVKTEFVESATREYIKETISVDSGMTNIELKDKARAIITRRGLQNYYCFELSGRRDPEISFDIAALLGRKLFVSQPGEYMGGETVPMSTELGETLELVDNTLPDYNFDKLCEDNKDNVIGMFIDAVKGADADPEIINRALFYGVAALQGIDY